MKYLVLKFALEVAGFKYPDLNLMLTQYMLIILLVTLFVQVFYFFYYQLVQLGNFS